MSGRTVRNVTVVEDPDSISATISTRQSGPVTSPARRTPDQINITAATASNELTMRVWNRPKPMTL